MNAMASQIVGVSIVRWAVCSGVNQRKSKLRVIGLCQENPPVIDGFPLQRASYAENVSIEWRHRVSPTANTMAADNLVTQEIFRIHRQKGEGQIPIDFKNKFSQLNAVINANNKLRDLNYMLGKVSSRSE